MWDDFILFVAIGFAAQLVDGALGMAYGLSGTAAILSLGFPPATASASVHAAEVFTTGISGLSHWRFGNVDWSFVWRLAVPGMLGGATGAYLLTTLPGDAIAVRQQLPPPDGHLDPLEGLAGQPGPGG